MLFPNLRQEKKLQKQGFKFIAGVDEVGRGAWAGPLVAGAVILDPTKKIKGIKDSKLLRSPQRQELFVKIIDSALAWAIGVVSEKVIDQIGLTKANVIAMAKAIKNLKIPPDYLLIDGFKLEEFEIPGLSIVKADYKITSVAAASIIAKVSRDQLMDQLAERYPHYGFLHHKGYGTAFHYQMICQYGLCKIHRKSFEPIKSFLN